MSDAAHSRYQFKPFLGSSHSWILKELEQLPAGAAILDIGPGSGSIGQHLRATAAPATVSAVEVDPETIEILGAQNIYDEIATDISQLSSGPFDCVLLLDVLEHLTEPEHLFRQAAAVVKPGGILCLSVPNIAHWSIRMSLLLGFFEYTDRGLLDRTHYQFFTRRRFRALCRSLDECRLEKEASSIEPAEFVLPQWITASSPYLLLRRWQLALAQTFPGLLAYQHLASIRKDQ